MNIQASRACCCEARGFVALEKKKTQTMSLTLSLTLSPCLFRNSEVKGYIPNSLNYTKFCSPGATVSNVNGILTVRVLNYLPNRRLVQFSRYGTRPEPGVRCFL